MVFIPGICTRYGGTEKGYIEVPCPSNVLSYNDSMGGVDLVNQGHKCYRIHTRVKKWYWALYTWFLNAQMVQAWHLYKATVKKRHQETLVQEQEADIEFEEGLEGLPGLQKATEKKKREEEKRLRRRKEKKLEEMPLLEFVRQSVEIILDIHSDVNKMIPARLSTARLSASSQGVVRFDMSRPHLIVKTNRTGRCKQCFKRSTYRGIELSPKFQIVLNCAINYTIQKDLETLDSVQCP